VLWRPHQDGRAGTAAIVAGADFDIEARGSQLSERLLVYTHQVFLRVSAPLPSIATFKKKRHDSGRAAIYQ
jgi:hypothetical protein